MTLTLKLSTSIIHTIQQALAEDIGSGDVTTLSIISDLAHMHGQIIAKQAGVVSGLDIAAAVYDTLDPRIKFDPHVENGARVENKQVLAIVRGPARSLLSAERVALNFLGRMSGIATLADKYVQAVAGTKAVILDTRKTAPGLRALDKLAVSQGGARNHRFGLFDMILIKDNHIDSAGSITAAVSLARQAPGNLEIEVETRTLEDVAEALSLHVERILLDNMSPAMMAQAVRMTARLARLEASGNITLENIRQVAETGVDFISIGALTHSVTVFDVSFDYLDA